MGTAIKHRVPDRVKLEHQCAWVSQNYK